MLDVDGPVHVLDFGGYGTPVVFVHGATSCAATWLGIANGLARAHRVIAPDLIGHGETPRAGRTATLRADQRVLDSVLDEFGLTEVTLVSITRGGLVAALEAAARPDRIRRVVILEPIAVDRRHIPPLGMLAILPLSMFPRLADRIAVRLFRARDGPDVAVQRWLDGACAHPDRVDIEQMEALVASMTVRLHDGAPFVAWAEAFREFGGILLHRRLDSFYSSITQPVLVIVGRDSTSASVPAVRAVARRHPGWKLEVLEGVGHPALEAPRVASDVILKFASGAGT